MNLPNPIIKARWVRVDEFPSSSRIGKHTLVIDKCYKAGNGGNVRQPNGKWKMTHGRPHSIKIAYVRDHPFLAELNAMPHVPRAVKAIYRASVRLGHYMATDAFPVLRDLNAAQDAWDKYEAAP